MYVTFIVYPLKCATLIMHLPYYREGVAVNADSLTKPLSNVLYVTFMIYLLGIAQR